MNDNEPYKIIVTSEQSEIYEKKSRFLVSIKGVETEEEAINYIELCKKKYWNATHNCSAFIIGRKAEIVRCSDDGEPSGTAGSPMLEVLLGSGVRNVVVVVTRYFGGTLLGTGGLVRAYSKAVKEGLAANQIETMVYGIKSEITIDYTGVGKIQYLLGQRKIRIHDSAYEDNVKINIVAPMIEYKKLVEDIIEVTNGTVKIKEIEKIFFIDK